MCSGSHAVQPGPWATPPPQAQGPLQSSPGAGALRTVLSREELLSSPSQQQGEQEALTHTKLQRSTYFSRLSGTCAGCTSILTQSPCLPAEKVAGTERDVSIHTAHLTFRKSPFLQHNPTFRARALPRLGPAVWCSIHSISRSESLP